MAKNQKAEGAINLGFGTSRSIQDVLDILCSIIPELKLRIKEMKNVNQPFEASCADLTRLKQLTQWSPPNTLERGIEMLIEFEQKRTSGRF